MRHSSHGIRNRPDPWIGLVVWCAAWAVMALLDGQISMPNLALVLVLGSAVAGVWLSLLPSLLINAGSVAFFSFFFVDPRLDFWPGLQDDLLLVITTLVVSALVSTLTARLRRAVANEALQTERVTQLRRLSEGFRKDESLVSGVEILLQMLREFTGVPAYAGLLDMNPAKSVKKQHSKYQFFGDPPRRVQKLLIQSIDRSRLAQQATKEAPDIDPLPVPIVSKTRVLGAVYVPSEGYANLQRLGFQHLKALCDLLGAEFERAEVVRQATESLEKANSQLLRNTLLTSISHDYRTPLATIISAASALGQQSSKYSPTKILTLAETIIAEAEHLNRMTTSTLQLVRLGDRGIELNLNWESLEELAGVAVSRLHRSFPSARIDLSFSPHLPLLYCDAILILQMLDNLLINSLKYSPENSLIVVDAHSVESELVLRVADSGSGIPIEWREKVFDAFQRMQPPGQSADSGDSDQGRRGVGLGLAVCRAIALAHNARISIETSEMGGAQVSVAFPLVHPVSGELPTLEELQ